MDGLRSYFKDAKSSVQTLTNGLKLTLEHLWDARQSRKPIGVADTEYFDQDKGLFTLQYPKESFPVPDNGRYRLHNEIDDCIVCDKCAKICPVNCIDIEPIKSPEELGKTSDGTPKRIHAARFDIDMAKCCFCGLCTTVCPTECLTMTKAYDFSEFDVRDHNYAFGVMTKEEITKAEEIQARAQEEKERLKKKTSPSEDNVAVKSTGATFRPKVKPMTTKPNTGNAKPKFRPKPILKKKPPEAND